MLLAEEGVVQVFLPIDGAQPIVGVVGALQLDVLKARLAAEYNLAIEFETTRFQICRWVESGQPGKVDTFAAAHRGDMAEDLDGALVYMAPSVFMLTHEQERYPDIAFSDVKDYQDQLVAS